MAVVFPWMRGGGRESGGDGISSATRRAFSAACSALTSIGLWAWFVVVDGVCFCCAAEGEQWCEVKRDVAGGLI